MRSGPKDSGAAIRRRPRKFASWQDRFTRDGSISAQTRAACSRNVTPAFRQRGTTGRPREKLDAEFQLPAGTNRRLTMDFETPRRRAADDTPPSIGHIDKSPQIFGNPSPAFHLRRHRWAKPEAITSILATIACQYIGTNGDSYAINKPTFRPLSCSHWRLAEGSAAISRSGSQPKATSFSARPCQLRKSRT